MISKRLYWVALQSPHLESATTYTSKRIFLPINFPLITSYNKFLCVSSLDCCFYCDELAKKIIYCCCFFCSAEWRIILEIWCVRMKQLTCWGDNSINYAQITFCWCGNWMWNDIELVSFLILRRNLWELIWWCFELNKKYNYWCGFYMILDNSVSKIHIKYCIP